MYSDYSYHFYCNLLICLPRAASRAIPSLSFQVKTLIILSAPKNSLSMNHVVIQGKLKRETYGVFG